MEQFWLIGLRLLKAHIYPKRSQEVFYEGFHATHCAGKVIISTHAPPHEKSSARIVQAPGIAKREKSFVLIIPYLEGVGVIVGYCPDPDCGMAETVQA